MNANEIETIIRANIDKTVRVVYGDGTTKELFVHTVDDEGFVCDIATEMGRPPRYAYWVRFSDTARLTLRNHMNRQKAKSMR